MSYEIKILTDKEFDKLPYPEAEISLGLADTKTGKAYVRYTQSDELNKYLINHELEHLIGEDRDEVHHGGDGVYYKGFGNIFQMLSGAGQSIAGAGKSLFSGLQNVGKGVSNVFSGFGGQQQAKPSIIPSMGASNKPINYGSSPQLSTQQLMSSKSAMAAANPTGQTFKGGALSGWPLTSPYGIDPSPVTANPVFKGNPNVSPSFKNFSMPPINVNMGGAPNPMGTPMVNTPAPQPSQVTPSASSTPNRIATATPGGNVMESIFGPNVKPGQLLTGAAMEGFGQFGIKTPNIPDISQLPSVQALRSYNIRNFQELDPALQTAINNDFDRIDKLETDKLIAQYKSLRPGADIESDSSFRRDIYELERMQGQRRTDAMAKYRFEFIQQQLGISQVEIQQLQSIAQMDVDSIMAQMGLDYASAQKFKDTFMNVGDRMISSSLGLYDDSNMETSNAA